MVQVDNGRGLWLEFMEARRRNWGFQEISVLGFGQAGGSVCGAWPPCQGMHPELYPQIIANVYSHNVILSFRSFENRLAHKSSQVHMARHSLTFGGPLQLPN
ncbi:unnamed protein product [Gulo gulo]|uniref:Uncharacterized protein n=1 Tax=Gulo gulo TaxID=48420 RepID=A0A9X9LTX5_GULGU|nr:unnamed protein product [Gulo gulo]